MSKENFDKLVELTNNNKITHQQIIEAIHEYYGYAVLNAEHTEALLTKLAEETGDPETFNPERTRIICHENTPFIIGMINRGILPQITYIKFLDEIYEGKILTQDFMWYLANKHKILELNDLQSLVDDWEIRLVQ